MNVHNVLSADVVAYLADSFKERCGLDIADCTAYFGDNYVGSLCAAVGNAVDAVLYLIRNVGDNLNGAAEVVAAALLVEDCPVYLTGGDVAVHRKVLVNEALVVTEVEVCLSAVVGDEYFAVLIGTHRARVNIDIGVEFLDSYLISSHFEQASE